MEGYTCCLVAKRDAGDRNIGGITTCSSCIGGALAGKINKPKYRKYYWLLLVLLLGCACNTCAAVSLNDCAVYHAINPPNRGRLCKGNADLSKYDLNRNKSKIRHSKLACIMNDIIYPLRKLWSRGGLARATTHLNIFTPKWNKRSEFCSSHFDARFPVTRAFIGEYKLLTSTTTTTTGYANTIDKAHKQIDANLRKLGTSVYGNYNEYQGERIAKARPTLLNDYNTFVSHHYRITSGDIIEYLRRKKIEYIESPLKVTLKFCPFCPPHKFKADNLYKHEIFKNSGNSYCHRCGYKGSLFDFKAAMGDLPGGLIEEPMDASMSNNPFASIQAVAEPPITMVNVTQYEMNLYHNERYKCVLEYLTETRGLKLETLKRYRVGAGEFTFSRLGSGKDTDMCVVFPWLMATSKDDNGEITVNRIKVRSIHDKSRMKILPRGGNWGMFGEHLLAVENKTGNKTPSEIVLTEGEFDAMSVSQATSHVAISLPNGSNSLPVALLPRLESLDTIYLWMDFDAAGQSGIEHFANKLGIQRTKIIRDLSDKLRSDDEDPSRFLHLKDANEILLKGFDLNKYINNATPLSHSQIVNFNDLRQCVFDELSNPKATWGIESITLPGLSKLLKGHRRGELSVWTGSTGSGKTTLLSQLSLDYCVQGVSTLWGSFEINNVRLIKTMLRQFSGKNLENSLDEFNYYADKFSELPLRFMKFHGSTSIDQVIDAMDYAVYVHDVRHIIIDNLQFMLSGQNTKVGEIWELQNTAIEKFRRFATHKNVHVSLVVHPRKEADGSPLGLSSVFGSVKSTQEADNVFILQSVTGEHRSIDIKKNRFAGNLGRITFRFDPVSLTAEELKVSELVANDKLDESLETKNTAYRIRPPRPTKGTVQNVQGTTTPSPILSSAPILNSDTHSNAWQSRDMSTFRLKSVASDMQETELKVDDLTAPETDSDTPVKKRRTKAKSAKEESKPEEMIIMRGVSISRSSGIKEFREFIKANGLGSSIKTAGRGIVKEQLYDKIKAAVPPSSIISPDGSISSVESKPSRIAYDFGVSTIKPYLEYIEEMNVEIRRDFDTFKDNILKGKTKSSILNESMSKNSSKLQVVKLPVYMQATPTSEQLVSKGIIYVKDCELLDRLAPLFNGVPVVAVDIESTGLCFRSDNIRLIQLATPEQPSVIIDVNRVPLDIVGKCSWLKDLLSSSNVVKVFHNGKFDINFLKHNGINVTTPIFDTMLAAKLLSASRYNWSCKLGNVAERYYNIELDKSQQFSDWTLDPLFEEQILYASKDAAVLLPLYVIIREKLKKERLDLIADVEFNCLPAVCSMETNGMKVDVERMELLQKQLDDEHKEAMARLGRALNVEDDPDFNYNSQRQLLKALQNLGVMDKNKKILIQDTSDPTLSRNAQHPAVAALRDYRKTNKAVTAFTLKIPNHIDPNTGRIYPNFNQIGADSGRFSCDNPNLQQIPRDKKFRECFVAEPGHKLVIADFSQIELRIAADIAQDEKMISAYKRGDDLHALTASLIKGKPMDRVTKEERQLAKAVNFGLVFGMSLTGFRTYAETNYGVKLSEKEAREIYNSFFRNFSGITQWHMKMKEVRPTEVRTLGNRLSIFDSFSFCRSLNYPVQGTSADITKESMAQLQKRVHEFNGKVIMCIHDEIIVEVPEEKAQQALDTLIEVMEAAASKFLKHVPCVAVGSIGDSWAEK